MQAKTGAIVAIVAASSIFLGGCCSKKAAEQDRGDELLTNARNKIALQTARGDWYCRRAPNFPQGGLWKFEKNPIADFANPNDDYYYIHSIRMRALKITPYIEILPKDQVYLELSGSPSTTTQLMLTHSRANGNFVAKIELKHVGSEPWLTGEISDGSKVRGHYYVFQLPTKNYCEHPGITDDMAVCRSIHVEYVDVDDEDAAKQRPIWDTTVFPLNDNKCAGAESSEGDGDEGPR